jgi:hypothetical protein
MAAENKTYTEEEVQAITAELQGQLDEALALIAEQQKALSAQDDAHAAEAVVVTVDKKKFKVLAPRFAFQGEVYEAKDLKKNKKLAEELAACGSGVLEAI